MATISVQQPHGLGQDEAMKRAQDLLEGFKDRYKVEVNWSGSNAAFKGTGFSGVAKVLADKIVFELDLGLLLRAMKGKIEQRVDKILKDKFT